MNSLSKFIASGIVATMSYAGIYLILIRYAFPEQAILSSVMAYILCIAISFLLHRNWSFSSERFRFSMTSQIKRYSTVQVSSLAICSAITWLCVEKLSLPEWAPIIPIVTIIPLISYCINAYWVFES